MTALPLATAATDSAATEGDVKNYLTGLRDFLNGLLGATGVPADARAALGVSPLSAATIASALGYTPANSSHTHSAYVSTNMTHGAVGSLCFAVRTDTGAAVAAGSTLAGSSLAPASVERTANVSGSPGTDFMVNASGTLSGTWRCLGYSGSAVAEANATLWQRIS